MPVGGYSAASIQLAVNVLEREHHRLTAEQAERVKKVCRKIGVGKSKTRQATQEQRDKWFKSRMAARLNQTFGPKAAANLFRVALGQAVRFKYLDGKKEAEDALDYIEENILNL